MAFSECYQYFPEVNFRGKYLWITESNHGIKFGAVFDVQGIRANHDSPFNGFPS